MVVTFDYLAKHGQLGNQLFQYGLLIGIKYKIGANIIIDKEVKKASYLFDFFDLKECEIGNFNTSNLYQEPHYHFDPKVFDITEDTNFRGYFQTEKYFEHCSKEIREEFKFKNHITDRVNSFLNEYDGNRLVSVHVRRGDYLLYQDAHPLCTVDYYNNAMDILDGDNVVFVCTSNDIDWCKENIKRNNVVFNYKDIAHDMCLISKCHDHIIANSTFSWWGSWLSDNIDKRVIAPSSWFGTRYSTWNINDLYCSNFIKI